MSMSPHTLPRVIVPTPAASKVVDLCDPLLEKTESLRAETTFLGQPMSLYLTKETWSGVEETVYESGEVSDSYRPVYHRFILESVNFITLMTPTFLMGQDSFRANVVSLCETL